MKTIFEEATERFWASVEDDEVLMGFIRARHGRLYKFTGAPGIPFDVAPTDCPALAVGPHRMPIQQATNRQEDYRFVLAADLRTAQESIWTAVNFWTLFGSVITGCRDSLWGLPYVVDLTVEDTTLACHNQENRGITWQVACNVVLHIRRDARIETLWAEAP